MAVQEYIVGRFTVEIEDDGCDSRGCEQYQVRGRVTGEEFETEAMRMALGAMGGSELELAITSLSMQPGDTDAEFFDGMSAEELRWRSKYGEELSSLASDMAVDDWVEFLEEEFDWEGVKEDALENEGRCFLGTVMALAPSGKYYTRWINSGLSTYEWMVDHAYYKALDRAAVKHGMWIEAGEGDPCDLFAVCEVEEEEEIA